MILSSAMQGVLVSRLGNRFRLPRYIWKHPANRGRRGQAFARAAGFQIRGRLLGKDTLVDLGSGISMRVRLGSTAASKFVYANPPDWPHMLIWDRVLNPEDLFLDVGANVGGYTLWAARLGARVIAFEPAANARAELQANLNMNPSARVEVLAIALANASGTAPFIIDGATSRLSSSGATVVQTKTLDEVLGDRYAAGVKIDVEGAERLVLEGASRALREHRIGLIQMEWNACSEDLLRETRQPVIDLLTEYGYEVIRPTSSRAFEPVRGDSYGDDVFARPSRAMGLPYPPP